MHDIAVRCRVESGACHLLPVHEDVVAPRDRCGDAGSFERCRRETHISLEGLFHILPVHDIRPLQTAVVSKHAASTALAPEDADAVLAAVGFVDLVLNELVAPHHQAGLHAPNKEILVIIKVGGDIFLYGKVESRCLPLGCYLGYLKVFHLLFISIMVLMPSKLQNVGELTKLLTIKKGANLTTCTFLL